MIQQTRVEVYDDNGLVNVYFIDTEVPTDEELIAEKESQLIEISNEIQALKGNI